MMDCGFMQETREASGTPYSPRTAGRYRRVVTTTTRPHQPGHLASA